MLLEKSSDEKVPVDELVQIANHLRCKKGSVEQQLEAWIENPLNHVVQRVHPRCDKVSRPLQRQ